MAKSKYDFFRTGQIGIVTLAIGMVPMILMMLLAGWQLSDNELDATLQGTINKNQKGLQSVVGLYHIARFSDVRESLREMSFTDKPSWNNFDDASEDDYEEFFNEYETLNQSVETVVNLDASQYDDTPSVEKYDLHVYYPDSENFYSRNEEVWLGKAGRWYIASPKSDHIALRFNIGGNVAQTYSGGQASGSTPPTHGAAP